MVHNYELQMKQHIFQAFPLWLRWLILQQCKFPVFIGASSSTSSGITLQPFQICVHDIIIIVGLHRKSLGNKWALFSERCFHNYCSTHFIYSSYSPNTHHGIQLPLDQPNLSSKTEQDLQSQVLVLHACMAQACNILIKLTVHEFFLLDIAASKLLESIGIPM